MMRMWFGLEIDVVGLPPLVYMKRRMNGSFHFLALNHLWIYIKLFGGFLS